MKDVGRRRFLAGATGALALAALPESVFAQAAIDPVVQSVVRGAPVRRGRVKLDLPQLADNGNSVPIKVTVESPMTAADHVTGDPPPFGAQSRSATWRHSSSARARGERRSSRASASRAASA